MKPVMKFFTKALNMIRTMPVEQDPTRSNMIADDYLITAVTSAMRMSLNEARNAGRAGWWDPEVCSISYLHGMREKALQDGDHISTLNYTAMLACLETEQPQPVPENKKPVNPFEDTVAELLKRQREFSVNAFGDHNLVTGVYGHLLKELDEVALDPEDITEWADCFILAMDGAHRKLFTKGAANNIGMYATLAGWISAYMQNRSEGTYNSIDGLKEFVKASKLLAEARPETWCAFASKVIQVMQASTNFTQAQLFEAVAAKQEKNAARDWGNIEDQDPSKPIEHKRDGEEQERKEAELSQAEVNKPYEG